MSSRTVIISTRCKLDLKMGYMVIRAEDVKRIFLDEFAILVIEKSVLSKDGIILDISKNLEIIFNFLDFDINKKSLISGIVDSLGKKALSAENFLRTQKLLSDMENYISDLAFEYQCDIVAEKINVMSVLKSAGICLRDEYTDNAEKLLDYMELVREFDKNKLFVTVNMRSFFDDDDSGRFMKKVISHEFYLLMVESKSLPVLKNEKRITVDCDMCEF